MNPDAMLARLRPPSQPRCISCAGLSGHLPIDDDGALVCYPCLLRAGRAAADPGALSRAEKELLVTAHGDVVQLIGDAAGWRWWWDATWPEAGR